MLMGVEKRTGPEKPLKIFEVEMVPPSLLKPHEALVEEELKLFLESLLSTRVFFKPLLIDRESLTILDGHHRWAGLMQLGAKRIPCIKLDYLEDDSIKVYTWYPVVFGEAERVFFVLENTRGVILEYKPREEAMAQIANSDFVLISQKDCASIRGDPKIIIRMLENIKTISLEFVDTEQAAFDALRNATMILLRRSPTKKEVVEHASRGEVFAPKTTRHDLPFRYQDIDVKYEELF
jgi:hypothetical protein